MESIEVAKSDLVTKQGSEVSSKDDQKRGKVSQRNYVMNDLAALRKKLSHEKRKQEFILAKEARDGSNAIVQMKASFFDFTKARFIEELQENIDIECKSHNQLV